MNLLSNSVKYADPDKPRRVVEVLHRPQDAEPGTCTVIVRDNGIGMSSEMVARIFEPFFRGHADRDGALGNSGSGLGLAIVDECVHALGGKLEVVSVPGDGTEFRLTLPDAPERPESAP